MSLIDGSRSRRDGGKGYNASGAMLTAANLIPLAGVLLWDWNIFNVVMLYWLENVIIGGINILKMLTCAPNLEKTGIMAKLKQRVADRRDELSDEEAEQLQQFEEMIDTHGGKLGLINHGSKLFFIPFFAVHYGIFCLVHGAFVVVLLGNPERRNGLLGNASLPDHLFDLIWEAVGAGGIWAALALAVSHLFSFVFNYLGKGEFRRTAVPILMMAPYGRVVVLHLAILFGAFATMALGSPVFLLVLLIVGKILLDRKFHQRAHRKLESAAGRKS